MFMGIWVSHISKIDHYFPEAPGHILAVARSLEEGSPDLLLHTPQHPAPPPPPPVSPALNKPVITLTHISIEASLGSAKPEMPANSRSDFNTYPRRIGPPTKVEQIVQLPCQTASLMTRIVDGKIVHLSTHE